MAHLCFDRGDLAFDMADSGLDLECRFSIGSVELSQVTCDAVLQLLHPSLELAVSEVLIAVVDCLELAAIDGHDRLGEELQAAAQDDELSAHAANRLTSTTGCVCGPSLTAFRRA